MKKYHSIMICLGIVLVLMGCGDDGVIKNPVSSQSFDERQLQTSPTQLSDDTADADIISPQYPPGTTVITAIGNSITYGEGSSQGGYPAMLQEKLRAAGHNVVVLNEGVPGENSPDTLARFRNVIVGADIVLIMIGTNDIRNPRDCPGGDCNTIGNIAAMIDVALMSRVVPVVSTITPVTGSNYEWMDSTISYFNSQIYSVAAQRNVSVADSYAAIKENGNEVLFSDWHHFNDQGYDVIAQTFYDLIVENNLIK